MVGEPLHKSTPKERSRQLHSNMKMPFLCSGHSPAPCPEVLFPVPGDVYSTVHFFPSLYLFHCTVLPVLQSLRNVRHQVKFFKFLKIWGRTQLMKWTWDLFPKSQHLIHCNQIITSFLQKSQFTHPLGNPGSVFILYYSLSYKYSGMHKTLSC